MCIVISKMVAGSEVEIIDYLYVGGYHGLNLNDLVSDAYVTLIGVRKNYTRVKKIKVLFERKNNS